MKTHMVFGKCISIHVSSFKIATPLCGHKILDMLVAVGDQAWATGVSINGGTPKWLVQKKQSNKNEWFRCIPLFLENPHVALVFEIMEVQISLTWENLANMLEHIWTHLNTKKTCQECPALVSSFCFQDPSDLRLLTACEVTDKESFNNVKHWVQEMGRFDLQLDLEDICIYIYMCVSLFIYIYICMYVYNIYTHIYIYMYLYFYMCIYIYIYMVGGGWLNGIKKWTFRGVQDFF